MSKPEAPKLERVNSYQWPSGHVGHLTENQIAALDRFKQLCESKGFYTPASSTTAASHDDETLLRYLRARKFIPQEAFGQFKDTEEWRSANHLDKLYETIDVEEYDATRRLYPQWTGRRDKRGIPLYVYEISRVDSKDVTAYTSGKDSKKSSSTSLAESSQTPKKMLRLFALYENLCRFVLPLCSAIPDREHGESPISQSNNIVDISKVGFAKFWSLRNHMSDASKLATAHYPETLDRIFVTGAPSFFPTVWQWAQKWFDPITVSKIFILSDKEVFPTLSKYVDPDNIPKKYGGNLNWSFGDMPFLEPGIADNLKWREDIREQGHRTFPKGPIRWAYDKDGDLVATAIGTENGAPRNRVIAGLHPDAGVARLALSPGRADTQSNTVASAAVTKSQTPASEAVQKTQGREANGAPIAPAPAQQGEAASGSAIAAAGGTATGATAGQPLEKGVEAGTAPTSAQESGTHTQGPGFEAAPGSAIASAGGTAAGAAGTYLNYSGDDMTSTDHHLAKGRNPLSAVPDSSRQGTYTVPYRDHESGIAHPPADGRQGTSSTRYEQQEGTHAEGQMGHGTPAVKVDSQGERQGIMEPNTVGQAPKEHPVPNPDEGSAPTMMEQAQEYAHAAVEQAKHLPATVMGMVGMGGKEEEVKEPEKKEDPEIDAMPDKNVEEFLRHKHMTQPQEPGR